MFNEFNHNGFQIIFKFNPFFYSKHQQELCSLYVDKKMSKFKDIDRTSLYKHSALSSYIDRLVFLKREFYLKDSENIHNFHKLGLNIGDILHQGSCLKVSSRYFKPIFTDGIDVQNLILLTPYTLDENKDYFLESVMACPVDKSWFFEKDLDNQFVPESLWPIEFSQLDSKCVKDAMKASGLCGTDEMNLLKSCYHKIPTLYLHEFLRVFILQVIPSKDSIMKLLRILDDNGLQSHPTIETLEFLFSFNFLISVKPVSINDLLISTDNLQLLNN